MIRRLGSEDAEIFRAIRLQALDSDPAAFASYALEWQKMSVARLQDRLREEAVFVSFDGDTPVGIMGIAPLKQSKMAHRGFMVLVYMSKPYRGTGRSEALLKTVEAHAKSSGLRQLELAVAIGQVAAIRFYERMGYSHIGVIPGGFLHEGVEIDEVLMVRRL